MNKLATSVRNHCLSPTRARVAIDAPLGPTAYGRMFPELPSFEADEQFLHALGRAGGVCDCGDVEDTPDSLVTPRLVGPSLVNSWRTTSRLTGQICKAIPIPRGYIMRAARSSILKPLWRRTDRPSIPLPARRSSEVPPWARRSRPATKRRGHRDYRRPTQRFAHADIAVASRHAQGSQRVCR